MSNVEPSTDAAVARAKERALGVGLSGGQFLGTGLEVAQLIARIEAENALNAELFAGLKSVAKWSHQGHGFFPAGQCGACKPVLNAIAKAEAHRAKVAR